jgi:4-hydroxybenzoate polyprenyltransferase
MLLGIVAVIIIQYVAHPLNDILDLDLDRKAAITETMRIKPIVDGRITVRETKALSTALLLVVVAIFAYLIYYQPFLLFPAAYGLGVMLAYSDKRIRLAYRPFAEVYIGIPVNTITVTVIAFIGSGVLSPLAMLVGIAFSFSASTFFLSMMSMDYPNDRLNDKRTTIVTFPHVRWCTYYPLIGLVAALISSALLVGLIGLLPALVYAIPSSLVFIVLAWYGWRVDYLREEYLSGRLPDPEGGSGHIRLRQLYLSIAYAGFLAVFFAVLGG